MSFGNKKNTFLMGTLILSIAGVIIKILGAVFRIPLAYFIGAVGSAYFQSAYSVYALVLTLATAGFPTAIAKLVSEEVALGNHRGANEIFKITHVMLFFTGFIGFLILFFGANFIVTDIQNNPGAVVAMKAIAPALLIVPSMSAYRGYYQGYQQMTRIAASQIIEQLFRVVFGLALANILMIAYGAKFGAAGAISGATIGAIGSLLFLFIIYLKEHSTRSVLIKNSVGYVKQSKSKILKRILKVVIPISIGACVMPIVNVVDTVIVIKRLKVAGFSHLESLSMFGQLTVMAMPIIVMPMIFTTAIGISLVPAISESYALKKFRDAQNNAKIAIKITLLLVLPCAFGLAALASPIMGLLFPKQPQEVLGTILFTLAPACIFLGLLYTFNGILQGIGKPMIPVYALVTGIVFKIVISYTLTATREFNILGSALGTLASYMIAAIIEYVYIKSSMEIEFDLMDYFIKPILTVVIMFMVTKLSYHGLNIFIGSKIATLMAIAVGGITYVLVSLGIGAVTADEIKSMPKGQKILANLRKMKLIK